MEDVTREASCAAALCRFPLGRLGASSRKRQRLGAVQTCRIALAFCFLLSAFGFQALAQTYSIDWYKIAGGGGTSTGGVYAVSGTIGQHDAGGPMTGGSYSLTGGFWSLIAVVQTGGVPTLYITSSGNTVTVYCRMFPAGLCSRTTIWLRLPVGQ